MMTTAAASRRAAAARRPVARRRRRLEPADIPPASSRAGTAVNAAMCQLGVPYEYAMSEPGRRLRLLRASRHGRGPRPASTCPTSRRSQQRIVAHVPIEAAQPGDLIFYYSPISHVGMYLGNGQLVHAPSSGDHVKVATVNWGKVTGVGRPG